MVFRVPLMSSGSSQLNPPSFSSIKRVISYLLLSKSGNNDNKDFSVPPQSIYSATKHIFFHISSSSKYLINFAGHPVYSIVFRTSDTAPTIHTLPILLFTNKTAFCSDGVHLQCLQFHYTPTPALIF